MLAPAIAQRLAADGRRIVVTGASGWLGRATLDLLHQALGEEFAGRVVAAGSRHQTLRITDALSVCQIALADVGTLPHRPTLLLHFAFLGKERAEAMDEGEYRAANAAIRSQVLDALGPIGVEALFVASSGAARFADDPAASPAMRLYGSLKRADEDAFAQWAEQTGRSAAIARICNLSGPHINKLPSYALSSFILDALAGRPVAVRAPHEVHRGYVAIRELVSLALALLLDAAPGVTRFDTGGEPVELGALAAMVGARFDRPVIRAALQPGRSDIYLGDDAGYQALIARHGIAAVPLARQIAETAEFLERASLVAPKVPHAQAC